MGRISHSTERLAGEDLPKSDGACVNSWPEWLTGLSAFTSPWSVHKRCDLFVICFLLHLQLQLLKLTWLLSPLLSFSFLVLEPSSKRLVTRWMTPPTTASHTTRVFVREEASTCRPSLLVSSQPAHLSSPEEGQWRCYFSPHRVGRWFRWYVAGTWKERDWWPACPPGFPGSVHLFLKPPGKSHSPSWNMTFLFCPCAACFRGNFRFSCLNWSNILHLCTWCQQFGLISDKYGGRWRTCLGRWRCERALLLDTTQILS